MLQELHADNPHGPFAFVLSLTREWSYAWGLLPATQGVRGWCTTQHLYTHNTHAASTDWEGREFIGGERPGAL